MTTTELQLELELEDDFFEEIEETSKQEETQQEETNEEDQKDLNEDPEEGLSKETDGSEVEYYKYLIENKHLLVDKDFDIQDFTEDKIEEALSQDQKNRSFVVANEIINALPDEAKAIIEYAMNGGKNLNEFFKNTQTSFSGLDPDKEEDAISIIKAHMKSKNIDDDVIDTTIEKYGEVDAKLETEAKKIIQASKEEASKKEKELIAYQLKTKQEQDQQKQKRTQDVITSIDSLKWSSSRKDIVKKEIFGTKDNKSPVTQKLNNILYNDPLSLVVLADLISYYDPKEGWDLSKFEKKEITQKTREEKSKLTERLKGSKNPRGITRFNHAEDDYEF